MGFVADVVDDVFDTDIGPQNRRDIAEREARRRAAEAERQQRAYEEAQAQEQAEFMAYQESLNQKMRQASYYDSSMDRKRALVKQRKEEAARLTSEKRGEEGINISAMAEQRGGTGGLLRGEKKRSLATREGFQKFKPKSTGLTLALRGTKQGGRNRPV